MSPEEVPKNVELAQAGIGQAVGKEIGRKFKQASQRVGERQATQVAVGDEKLNRSKTFRYKKEGGVP